MLFNKKKNSENAASSIAHTESFSNHEIIYEFHEKMCAKWGVTNSGIFYKDHFYNWDTVLSVKFINDTNSKMINGVYAVTFDGCKKDALLAWGYKSKDRARNALDFILKNTGLKLEFVKNVPKDMLNIPTTLSISDPSTVKDALQASASIVPSDETIYVALKGAFKEYLICTDKMVYIIKKGYMTGHMFGDNLFNMPYTNITNAQIDYHLATGYFIISAGGIENRPLSYWSQNNDSAQTAPNAISITGNTQKNLFHDAANFILQKISSDTSVDPITSKPMEARSLSDELRELKELLDDGIITQDDFNKKKSELLGI